MTTRAMSESALPESATQPEPDVDVAICGGGPVGLSLAYLLGRAGVKTALFEKRATTTTLPKGQYVHAQTSELYRQWGVWSQLEKCGWSIQRSNGQGFYLNVAAGPVAEVRATHGTDEDYQKKWESLTPVFPRKIPASDYEAALCRQASLWPSVDIAFNAQVVDARQSDGQAQLVIRDRVSGAERTVRARYLVACDGAHSFVRNRIGQGEDNGPAFLNQILVEFEADLEATLGRDGFFHSFVLDPRYAGWFGSQHPDTGLWRYSFRHDEEELPDQDIILARMRGALGEPDLPLKIVRTYRFDYTTGLLRRWREGQVFFAGDAAHWHSPWGGFGANSGVQDANNLAWKLALVIKGLASEDLLDTYEVERKAKGWQTVKAATYNSMHFQAIAQSAILGEPTLYSHGRLSEVGVRFLREVIEPHGANAVLHTGYQLGTVYQSRAVMDDGAVAPAPRLKDYVETTVPGVRAPHVWLRDREGKRVSLVDLWGRSFVLVAVGDAEAWRRAAAAEEARSGLPLTVLDVGAGGDYVPEDDKFARLYGAEKDVTMVLVRPDGFVARRFYGDAARDGATFLARTFDHMLGRPTPHETAAAPLPEAVVA